MSQRRDMKKAHHTYVTATLIESAFVLPRSGRTCDEEVAMFLQSLAVLAHYVVESQVQLVEGQSLLRVRCRFPCGVVVGFLLNSTISVLMGEMGSVRIKL